jgi:signal transduction histidine kinase
MRFSRLSLLWKILLSTSVALTALFAVTGWIVQDHVVQTTARSLDEEVKSSFQAYESLWKSRADRLGKVSLILSSMSDVRAAFSTGDQATIRDTARELWAKISDENALFLVTDPKGRVIASLGGVAPSLSGNLPFVQAASSQFPRQAVGFLQQDGLYQIVVTPVYVESLGGRQALLNVLVAGYAIDALVAQEFKKSTGGSDFLFLAGGQVIASTLNPRATAELRRNIASGSKATRISDGVSEYAPLNRPLLDVEGKPIGDLWILRSFEDSRQRILALRRQIAFTWLCAMIVGLWLTYLLAGRIVEPVKQLDRAAAEVASQNYDFRLAVASDDELGRLAGTFNAMCDSIQSARAELIRQERISTIGRLSSSIVHDLRNPLAAIYGGAEMLVDTELSAQQMKRLAANIYRSSRRIQELLQDLVNVSRGKSEAAEMCLLREVVEAACDASAAAAEAQAVRITFKPDAEEVELPIERARMERVFLNLIGNALEAMPDGGAIEIVERAEGDAVFIEFSDTGPGIEPAIREKLFEPFVSAGKKNGLGLGLALSRQTVLDHGGEIWIEGNSPGARFIIRLPLRKNPAKAAEPDRASHHYTS